MQEISGNEIFGSKFSPWLGRGESGGVMNKNQIFSFFMNFSYEAMEAVKHLRAVFQTNGILLILIFRMEKNSTAAAVLWCNGNFSRDFYGSDFASSRSPFFLASYTSHDGINPREIKAQHKYAKRIYNNFGRIFTHRNAFCSFGFSSVRNERK